VELGLGDKRAVVAASSSGLGLGTARALAAEGCRVVTNGRDEARLTEATTSVPGAVAVQGDVGTVEGAERFLAQATEELGGVDILVTNAGGPPPGTFASTAVGDYGAALEQNLTAMAAMCHGAVPSMQERGWGRVVAITSISVRQPIPTLLLSNTARAGLTGFLKTLAVEVAGDGVTVNSLQPGYHRTPRLTSVGDADLDALAAAVPAGRLGDPDDFGRIAAFLCSDAAAFVTGAALNVDGGAFSGLQ
jgi:3-oxoacyl-[acyl-carrier protein] reductase